MRLLVLLLALCSFQFVWGESDFTPPPEWQANQFFYVDFEADENGLLPPAKLFEDWEHQDYFREDRLPLGRVAVGRYWHQFHLYYYLAERSRDGSIQLLKPDDELVLEALGIKGKYKNKKTTAKNVVKVFRAFMDKSYGPYFEREAALLKEQVAQALRGSRKTNYRIGWLDQYYFEVSRPFMADKMSNVVVDTSVELGFAMEEYRFYPGVYLARLLNRYADKTTNTYFLMRLEHDKENKEIKRWLLNVVPAHEMLTLSELGIKGEFASKKVRAAEILSKLKSSNAPFAKHIAPNTKISVFPPLHELRKESSSNRSGRSGGSSSGIRYPTKSLFFNSKDGLTRNTTKRRRGNNVHELRTRRLGNNSDRVWSTTFRSNGKSRTSVHMEVTINGHKVSGYGKSEKEARENAKLRARRAGIRVR